jgi:hypothetical protein
VPTRLLDAVRHRDDRPRRVVEGPDEDLARHRPPQAVTHLEPGLERIEHSPGSVFAAERRIAAIEGKGDFDDVIDADIRDDERCRQPPVQHETVEIGFAAEGLKRAGARMLDTLLAAEDANEMHIEPLEGGIELHGKMRGTLGTGTRQHALRRPVMPRIFCPGQIDLDIMQQPANAVGNAGIRGLRHLQRVRLVRDPTRHRGAAHPLWRGRARALRLIHAHTPERAELIRDGGARRVPRIAGSLKQSSTYGGDRAAESTDTRLRGVCRRRFTWGTVLAEQPAGPGSAVRNGVYAVPHRPYWPITAMNAMQAAKIIKNTNLIFTPVSAAGRPVSLSTQRRLTSFPCP